MTLSPRQLQIAAMLADGLPVKQVAACIVPRIKISTVRFHIHTAAARIPGNGKPIHRLIRWYLTRAA